MGKSTYVHVAFKYILAAVPMTAGATAVHAQSASPQAPATEHPARPALDPNGAPSAPKSLWADFDGDGSMDLYLVVSGSPDRLLCGNREAVLEDATALLGLDGIWSTRTAQTIDFDGDGRLDLLLTTAAGALRLFAGRGPEPFEEVTKALRLEGLPPVESCEWRDYDQDGWADLIAIDATGGLSVYRNEAGTGFSLEASLPATTTRPSASLTRGGGDQSEVQPWNEPGTPGPTSPVGRTDRELALPRRAALDGDAAGRETGDVIAAGTPSAQLAPAFQACLHSIRDAVTSACLQASSVPMLGALYPISEELFVDAATGKVGLGTTTPERGLHVVVDDLAADRTVALFENVAPPTSTFNIGSIKIASGDTTTSISSYGDAYSASPGHAGFSSVVGLNSGVELEARDPAGSVRIFTGGSDPSNERVRVNAAGRVGVGTTSPQANVHVVAPDSETADAHLLVAHGGNNFGAGGRVGFGARGVSHPMATIEGFLRFDPGGGWEQGDMRFMTRPKGSGPTDLTERMRITDKGRIGVGTSSPSGRFNVAVGDEWSSWNYGANLIISGSRNNSIGFLDHNGGPPLALAYGSGTLSFSKMPALDNTSSPPNRIMHLDDNGLTVHGRTTTRALTITGGADLAEPFASQEALVPGTVVCLDPQRPGAVVACDDAYQRTVAGIVSGAGGVHPGICLSQENMTTGDSLVALTGRVYARASTIGGPIEVGDPLTTSTLPGRAMRASDSARSFGAVIGKAMTPLLEGDGLVLVLVNLQ